MREIVFARVFGASVHSDAFLAAFKIPNLLRSIFAEGAASNAFLPLLGEAEKRGFLKEFITIATIILSTLASLVWIAMLIFPNFFVTVFAPGLSEKTLDLAGKSLRFLSLFIVCMTFTLIVNNILNYQKRFGLAALIQIALNLAIAATLSFAGDGHEPPLYLLNILILLFSLVTTCWLLIWLRKFFVKVKIDLIRGLGRRFLRLFSIGLLISSVYQIMVFASGFTASYFEPGSISLLNYADRIYQVPYGILGVSLAQVSLSYLVSMTSEDRVRFLKRSFYFSSRVGFLCAGFLIALSDILVKLFYGSGLDSSQLTKIAGTLRNLSFGLPFAILGLVLSRYLYATSKHRYNLIALGSQALIFIFLCVTTFYLNYKPLSVTSWFESIGSQIEALAACISLSVIAHYCITGVLSMGLRAFIGSSLDLFWPFLAGAVGIFSVVSVDLSDFSLIGQLIIYSIIYFLSFVIIFFIEFIGRKF